jgi:hypothetical protein
MGLAPEAASPWIYPFCKNTQRIPGVLLSQGVWICSLGHPHQVVARGVENQGHAVPPCLHLGIRVRSSQLIGFCVVLPWYAYPSLSTTVSQIYSDIIYDIIIQSEAINRCEVGQCWPGLEVWYGNEPSGCQRTGLFFVWKPRSIFHSWPICSQTQGDSCMQHCMGDLLKCRMP